MDRVVNEIGDLVQELSDANALRLIDFIADLNKPQYYLMLLKPKTHTQLTNGQKIE